MLTVLASYFKYKNKFTIISQYCIFSRHIKKNYTLVRKIILYKKNCRKDNDDMMIREFAVFILKNCD